MANLTAKIYNQDGTEAGEQKLEPKVFGVKANAALIHEIVVAQESNARETIANTKTRADVRGGGKKPWKQKHTGRARHGSTRSPIWKGGGVVFGPRKTRVWGKKVNKKAKQAALRMVLSDKAAAGAIIVLSAFKLEEYKTKAVAELLKKLPTDGRKSLIALPTIGEKIWKSAANIKTATVSKTDSLNIIDIMKNKFLITTVDGIAALTKALS
jgi:large subunit ribosomal protein L4